MITARVPVAVAMPVAMLLIGCEAQPFSDAMELGGVMVDADTLNLGHSGFMQYCRPCHGELGDGKGPLSVQHNPPPRDFRLGIIKFARVPAGSVPRDEDLYRTLRRGLRGTAMLPWPMPDEELHAIIQFTKTFSERRRHESPPEPIAVSDDPWSERIEEAVTRGRRLYHGTARCIACHPAYMDVEEVRALADETGGAWEREDLHQPKETKSDHGYAIRATNFATDTVRVSKELEDLYWVTAAGVGGTAMPTWKDALPEEDLWALAYYVRHVVIYGGDRR